MAKTIDACGLTCPAPVLFVKDAVEKEGGEELIVLVDNPASAENVERFLSSRGYKVESTEKDGIYSLAATTDETGGTLPKEATAKEADAGESAGRNTVIIIMTDRMGNGDEELGRKLMVNYIKTLNEIEHTLSHLIFVNGGVKLTIDSSPVLEELQAYSDSGVVVLACGTCLEYFKLTPRKAVGAATNMLDIVMAQQLAGKVITMG